ncbi:CaiB/BaiF CoA transferase family protein [Lysinibacillus sp. 54212]|uniref:CaiB/BaiF CoA transferase family protein n=1 Tax=Lysinibacillus sp. 54212 TaxID=3119829 RepID=UPI002FC9F49B
MSLPLDNIKILDLSRLLPGPYCTQVLADFGADVIKIEEPKLGDYMRWESEKLDDAGGAMFHSLNRNKRSITLDLKSDDGKQIFKELVKTADVVLESFRPGVMERLGLSYEVLNEINEKLIYCAITGFGQTGPYKNMPGHDVNFVSYAGIMELQGEETGKPILSSVQIADIAGGAQQAITGILLALFERTVSGKGQFVDISMLDGSVSLLQTTLPQYLVTNEVPKRGQLDLSGGLACYSIYRTKDNRHISVGAFEKKFWRSFCQVIGEESFIEQSNAPSDIQQKMRTRIQEILLEKTLAEWMTALQHLETCVSPILTFDEVVEDPQIQDRDMIIDITHENGSVKQIGIPIKLSRTPASIRTSAPKLGEHNNQIIGELRISQ